jgi:hypothetical protein
MVLPKSTEKFDVRAPFVTPPAHHTLPTSSSKLALTFASLALTFVPPKRTV